MEDRSLRSLDASHATKVIEHARKMSNALLKLRPLGGSEMFTRIRTGDHEEYYADPEYCASLIERLHSDLRVLRGANAILAQANEVSGPSNSNPHKESGI